MNMSFKHNKTDLEQETYLKKNKKTVTWSQML